MTEPARTLVEWSYFGVKVSVAAKLLGMDETVANREFNAGATQPNRVSTP